MSMDHKPGRKAETRRILRSGGYLDETDPRNPRVVCDTLNVRKGAVSTLLCFIRIASDIASAGVGLVASS